MLLQSQPQQKLQQVSSHFLHLLPRYKFLSYLPLNPLKSVIGAGTSFEFWNSVDLLNNRISYTNILPGFVGGNDYTTGNYIEWKIDSSTKFYVCSDLLGNVMFTCNVHSLSVWFAYDTTASSYPYLWGLSRNNFNIL